MKNKKTFSVVMLPTDKESNIYTVHPDNKRYEDDDRIIQLSSVYVEQDGNLKGNQNQHLYIISDDEIKEGDWNIWGEKLDQISQANRMDMNLNKDLVKGAFKKIVATTDKSLVIKKDEFINSDIIGVCPLPQLPESFIQAYIKAYNDGKSIIEVDLECYFTHETGYDKFLSIKIRPDNTVIVHQSKMYSRAEIEKLIVNAIQFGISLPSVDDEKQAKICDKKINKWISENL